jgi:hypothetical protein
MCKAQGIITAASVVDHITPHHGNPNLFWMGELQSLCWECHSKLKQSQEVTGFHCAIDASGYPTDPNHPFNRASYQVAREGG